MNGKKPKDYTLAEVRTLCEEQFRRDGCVGCRLADEDGDCLLDHDPRDWDIPRVTITERRLLQVTGAKWISRDGSSILVDLWLEQPKPNGFNGGTYISDTNNGRIGTINGELFPSIQPGECWSVAELLGENETEGTT